MTPRLHIILFAIVACLSGMRPAAAMDPRMPFRSFVLDHWSVEQGLPQITVLGMAEARAGFLWINTQSAVARFDGVRFVTFDRTRAGVDTSMLSAVWADPVGQVWFGGARGLLRERGGQFTALGGQSVQQPDDPLPPGVVALLDPLDGGVEELAEPPLEPQAEAGLQCRVQLGAHQFGDLLIEFAGVACRRQCS